jgi:hypothetical protein
MGILLAFAPFIAFAVIDRLVGSTEGLIAGALVSAALLIRDWMSADRSPKILETGTFILFAAMALYALLANPDWSLMGVRLRVDAGLLLIVLITMILRKPFTIQYARESVAKELWDSSEFLRTNYVITAVWALAFVVLVIADLILVYMPDWPPRVGILLTIAAFYGAFKFTAWYPDKVRASAAKPS